jgi:hypothetical protein
MTFTPEAELVEAFRSVDRRVIAWLAKEREDAVKFLVGATDPTVIARAQGKHQFIEKIEAYIAKSK